MKKCKYCNIMVDTDKSFCPLCYNRLDSVNDNSDVLYSMRNEDETTIKTSKFLLKLFIYLSIFSMACCIVINYLTTPNIWWSPLVIVGELYIWILIKHTILSKKSLFRKIVLQIISILLILYSAEKLSLSHWLLPYAFPSSSLAILLIMTLISLISKKRGEYVFGFLIISLILGLASFIILLLDLFEFKILHIINLSACMLFLLALLLFGFNSMKAELAKKWHI